MTAHQIELWTIRFSASAAVVATLEQVLSPEERDRANRFRFQHLRDAYIVGRGGLRQILSLHLGQAPAAIPLVVGKRGKPRVSGPGSSQVQFNVSHSGEFALMAISLEGLELGVDIEKHRPLPDLFDIARRYFCPEELAELKSVSSDRQEESFFLCWTRKEAYIKAIGEGLHAPLDRFQVSLKPGELARFLHVDHDAGEALRWSLHDLNTPAGYSAALAYQGEPRRIVQRPITTAEELLSIRLG
jgi:4'-phosphopantetheinyl transferase